jgi:hypothetical protein
MKGSDMYIKIRKVKRREFNLEKWIDDQLRNGRDIRYNRLKLERSILPLSPNEILNYFPERQEGDEFNIVEFESPEPLTDEQLLVARAESKRMIEVRR